MYVLDVVCAHLASLAVGKDGHDLVAIGSEDGIWIGMLHQPESASVDHTIHSPDADSDQLCSV